LDSGDDDGRLDRMAGAEGADDLDDDEVERTVMNIELGRQIVPESTDGEVRLSRSNIFDYSSDLGFVTGILTQDAQVSRHRACCFQSQNLRVAPDRTSHQLSSPPWFHSLYDCNKHYPLATLTP
jgi:hypothetical protein